MKIICQRCKEVIVGKDEHDAEVKFSMHTCSKLRNLSEMPLELLEKVAKKEMSELEAWRIHDQNLS